IEAGFHAIVDATTITVKNDIQVTIETAAQLIDFINNEILTNDSAKDIASFVNGSRRWDQLEADIFLKADTTFDLSVHSAGAFSHASSTQGSANAAYAGSLWTSNVGSSGCTAIKSSNGGIEYGTDLYTFNGQGSTIKNFTVRGYTSVGFFSECRCNIKNVTFVDCYSTSLAQGGIVAGYVKLQGGGASTQATTPVIENVHTYNCRVRSMWGPAGGLVGDIFNHGQVIKCSTNSTKTPNAWTSAPGATNSSHTSGWMAYFMQTAPVPYINDGVEREIEGGWTQAASNTQGYGIGGLTGNANAVTFEQCSSSVSVSGRDHIGGLTGTKQVAGSASFLVDCSYMGGSLVAAGPTWRGAANTNAGTIGALVGEYLKWSTG
ncbi:uncharacterized protein METZ01_LOCUS306485, partial [marine metagenome]